MVSLGIFRLLARELPEDLLINNIKEGLEKYESSGNTEDRPMQFLAILMAKWGDESQGINTEEDILKSSKDIEESVEMKKSADFENSLKELLNKNNLNKN